MSWEVWGRHFLELLLCLPAGLLCFVPVRARLRVNARTFLLAELGSIIFFAAVGASVVEVMHWPENALLIPALLIFFSLYCKLALIERLQALFVFLTVAALMGFCGVFTDVVLARVEFLNPDDVSTWISSAMQLGIGLLLSLLCWPLMDKRVGWLLRSFAQPRVWRIVWIMPLAHLVLFIVMTPQDYGTILVNRVQPLGAVILLFLLALMLFLVELFYHIARSLSDSAALREENHFLAAQASQYAALSSYIKETRKLRHDFRQHLRVLSGLAAKGDIEALNSYLRAVNGEEQDEIRFIFANPAVNALAGYYESRARSEGVNLEWKVSLPEQLSVPEVELCVLLGNLMENALDGALTQPEGMRYVRVICRQSGDLMCIIVENGFDGNVRKEKGRFLSTKHVEEGYGLSSVKAAVERHKGSMAIDTEDNIFRVSLLLNMSFGDLGG